jgi:Glycosyltransferase family 87
MTPASASAAASLRRVALPVAAIVVFTVFVGAAVFAAAGAGRLGYDFLAYYAAANRVLSGGPLYDTTISQAGGFGLFLYPPPFVLVALPFVPLAQPVAVWGWTLLMVGAFALGVALMPVRSQVRWLVVLLAGLSWPFAYALKLGQVGPLLLLLFAAGWRWLDRPAPLGASVAAGVLVKVQPGLLVVWALLTRRWRAVGVTVVVIAFASLAATIVAGGVHVWGDYLAVLRSVSDPITTAHNFTPGAIAYQLGAPAPAPAVIQLLSSLLVVGAVVVAARMATAEASFLVAVIASQLLSPVLWDHYALLLLLPTAWLLNRGHAWAVAIPLATSTLLLSITPPAAYPVAFAVALGAVLGVGIQRGPGPERLPVAEPA